jgi:hypothetical protein
MSSHEETMPGEEQEEHLSLLHRNTSHNSTTSTTSSNSLTNLTPAIQKLSRAIPYQTQAQKRARWIPGARYFPLLFVQWLWHPIAVLVEHFKQDDELHHHDAHYHHHNIHHSHGGEHSHHDHQHSGRTPTLSNGQGDIFLE